MGFQGKEFWVCNGVLSPKFRITLEDWPLTLTWDLLSLMGSSLWDPLCGQLWLWPPIGTSNLIAKKILQKLCRRKIGWDDALPNVVMQERIIWMQHLYKLEDLKVNCCLKTNSFGTVKTAIMLLNISSCVLLIYVTTSVLQSLQSRDVVNMTCNSYMPTIVLLHLVLDAEISVYTICANIVLVYLSVKVLVYFHFLNLISSLLLFVKYRSIAAVHKEGSFIF